MKAVKKFKSLLIRKRPDLMEGIFGRASRIVQPPEQMHGTPHPRAQSAETEMRRPVETALTTEGVRREIPVSDEGRRLPEDIDKVDTLKETPAGSHLPETLKWTDSLKVQSSHPEATKKQPHDEDGDTQSWPPLVHRETGKGQAHNPLEDTLFLDIGDGDKSEMPGETHVISESPGATDFNVYERAYQEEIDRILAARSRRPTIYLTRRVESVKKIRENENITDHSRDRVCSQKAGLANLVQRARANIQEKAAADNGEEKPEEKPE
jgi:calcium/calmodulin-dependent protein kinase kinase 2